MAILKPSPTSPINASSPTRTPSSASAAVSEPCRPILPWISWLEKPSDFVGTRKAASPRCCFSGSVWAKISATSAWLPSEIHILLPVISQPPSTFFARVRWLAASEPVSGSVSPKQPSASPEHSGGKPALLLVPRAPAHDRGAHERGLHGHDRAHRRAAAPDLLDHERIGHVVEARAAVLARDDRAEVALVGDLAHELRVEVVVAIVLARARDDLLVREVASRLADQLLLV